MRTRTTAILPSSTRLYPALPTANMFHADWSRRSQPGTYLLLAQGKKHIILSGYGPPEGYPGVGDFIYAHHDQTLRDLGVWRVIAKIEHDRVGELPIKSAPLYVYK
jgi:hypothetical protein